MVTPLIGIDELPSQSASQVKNKWGEVTRQVQEVGAVAVRNHASVELVMMSASAYRSLMEIALRAQANEQLTLDQLSTQFKRRLEILQRPDARTRVNSLLSSRGSSKRLAIAGEP